MDIPQFYRTLQRDDVRRVLRVNVERVSAALGLPAELDETLPNTDAQALEAMSMLRRSLSEELRGLFSAPGIDEDDRLLYATQLAVLRDSNGWPTSVPEPYKEERIAAIAGVFAAAYAMHQRAEALLAARQNNDRALSVAFREEGYAGQ